MEDKLECAGRVSLSVDCGLACYVIDSCGIDLEKLKAAMGIGGARTRGRVRVLSVLGPTSPHVVSMSDSGSRGLEASGRDRRHIPRLRPDYPIRGEAWWWRLSIVDGHAHVSLGKTASAASPGKAMASLTAAETTMRRSMPCSHLLNRKTVSETVMGLRQQPKR